MEDFLLNGATSSNPRSYIFSDMLPSGAVPPIVFLAMLLTTPTDFPINGLLDHFNQTSFGKQSYSDFLAMLDTIGLEIDDRDSDLVRQGSSPYPYLHPSRVPASIDI